MYLQRDSPCVSISKFVFSTPKAGLCPSPPMTVACSDDLGGLDLEPILLTLDKTDQMFKPSTRTGHGLGPIFL